MSFKGKLTTRERELLRKMAKHDPEEDERKRKRKNQGFEIETEIFATGLWNGMEFTTDDLRQIASAFHTLGENHAVPLKFGHNEDQPFTDGQPALGWVVDVFVAGDKLRAKFVNVPEIVMQAIEAGRYSKISIELDMSVEHGGETFPLVLSGVALLGADIPAVNTLEDLQAFMGRETVKGERHAVFTAIGNRQEETLMPETPEQKAAREALEATLKEQAKENATFKRENEELKAAAKTRDEDAQKAVFSRQREEFATTLDEMVKANKITPAMRDSTLSGWKDDQASVDRIAFAVKQLDQLKGDKPPLSSDDQGKGQGSGESDEDDRVPGEILLARVREVRVKEPRITFSAAVQRIMEADPKLARAYIDENGVMADNRRAAA